LNPKVALFFLAFLPQFIDSAAPSKMTAFLILGFTFVTTGTIWCLILAWFAAAFSERLRGNATVAAMLNRAVGSPFIFLGLRLAGRCPTVRQTKVDGALRPRCLSSPNDALAAGHHADEFDSIALREKTLHPFPLMKCSGIVLD
jgi:LysE type translocator